MNARRTILAIESSCDESSVAILRDGRIVALCTETQSIHQSYGGVVPELAGRSHLDLMDPLMTRALAQAAIEFEDIDLFCATMGPGLVGSLLVGSCYARGMACAAQKPFRGIHHVEAHLWSAEIEGGPLPLPFLVLLVSGGHTLLILVHGLRRYSVLGTTLDDAMGEAYDKVGKLLGLSFPAGAEVDRLAGTGDPTAFAFPVATPRGSFDFSFSGLKTAVLYKVQSLGEDIAMGRRTDLLASFQKAAVGSVIARMDRAVAASAPCALVAAGGVAANSALRARIRELGSRYGLPCIFPPVHHCMDNAAMIAHLAWKLDQNGIAESEPLAVRPRWTLEDLSGRGLAA